MKTAKKLLLALSYGTYSIVCLALLFGIGNVAITIPDMTFGRMVMTIAMGAIMILLLILLGILILALIDAMFGEKKTKVMELSEEILPTTFD